MDFESDPPPPEFSEAWDWSTILDFAVDDHAPLSLPFPDPSPPGPPQNPEPTPPPPPGNTELIPPPPGPGTSRVRKRDPRLVCENYLAGRVPCACPEIDEKEKELEEEDAKAEEAAGGRKRVKSGPGAVVKCQVAGCEADIRELKGYHRRHRVCLLCANASAVVVDGEDKRYCQQCGKFHILADFDEGKRSCRRKLERHNKRRRRRPTDSRDLVEKENDPEGDWSIDTICDGELRKDADASNGFARETVETTVNNKIEMAMVLESEDGRGSPGCSVPSIKNVQSTNNVLSAASDGNNADDRTNNSKSALSSTLCDDKSVYSSVCPTGRVSFKLYDWNPAEFPRRLRHQIFQWLASMPVELEGYIRPGCTILTIFIAMPQFMWDKLHEDIAFYVQNLVDAPESLFSGRGNFLMYLGNKIVQILKDGTSLMNIKMEVKAPRIHYIYPTFFEAGKPMEIFACGMNLHHPKFRFLVSFAGKYLVYDSCNAISQGNNRSDNGKGGAPCINSEHETLMVKISETSSEVFGPAFVEVENEAGLSNFVPILFGNKAICADLVRLRDTIGVSLSPSRRVSQIAVGAYPGFCECFASKHAAMADLLMDIAWVLNDRGLDTNDSFLSSTNIKRLTCLLEFSLNNELFSVLEAIQRYYDNLAAGRGLNKSVNMSCSADLNILLKYLSQARDVLDTKASSDARSELHSRDSTQSYFMEQNFFKSEGTCNVPWTNQDIKSTNLHSLVPTTTSTSRVDEENVALVSNQTIRRPKCYPHLGVRWPQEEGWSNIFPWKAATSARLAVFLLVSVCMCFAACIALIHPGKASDFAISIRRGLFGGPLT